MTTRMVSPVYPKVVPTWQTCYQEARMASWSSGICPAKSPSSRLTHMRGLCVALPLLETMHSALTTFLFRLVTIQKSAFGPSITWRSSTGRMVMMRTRLGCSRIIHQWLRTLQSINCWGAMRATLRTSLPQLEPSSKFGTTKGPHLSNLSSHGM